MIQMKSDGDRCVTRIEGTSEEFAEELACLLQANVITAEFAERLIDNYNGQDRSDKERQEQADELKGKLYSFQTEAKK